MKQAIIYTRFSDRPDSETSESCEYQKEFCQEWCDKNDYKVVGYFEDRAISGKANIKDRPGLSSALTELSEDVAIVVYHWDRLARDRMIHIAIEGYIIGRGGYMISASTNSSTKDESPEDELMRSILQTLSVYDRQMKAARTKNAMLSHQARGRIMSKQLPYGFKRDPDNAAMMIKDAVEQETLRLIMSLRNKGYGFKRIATALDDSARTPRNADKWSANTIRRIVKREEGD